MKAGEKLKKWREAQNLTQSDVALVLGYSSAQFISNCERGYAQVPRKNLKKLARAYKIPVEELIKLRMEREGHLSRECNK